MEELYRLGVRHCCIAPGSRSAPLTLTVAEHDGLTEHVHFDERGLGFFALGLAKSRREPVAIITTSGTAVANLYPALIEAKQTATPLIVITADRPPELIDCGANQAIDQQGIYAGYPEAALNLPVPDEHISVNWLLTSIDQAFARSCARSLPLHINCQFREPLYPDGHIQDYSHVLAHTGQWLNNRQPFTRYQRSDSSHFSVPAEWQDFIDGRGLLVVGRIDVGSDVDAIVRLAEALGWPLIVDIQSQLHGHPMVLKHADLLLSNDSGCSLLQKANRVFQIGGQLVSRRLGQFLEQQEWQHYLMLDPELRRLDTAHRQTVRIVGNIAECCHRLVEQTLVPNRWAESLQTISNRIVSCNESILTKDGLTERWICNQIGRMLPKNAQLFIGNSLPIRMMDLYSTARLPAVFSNRGASGIDGLIATAAGCCAGTECPTILLLGDISFLHDLNSLQLIKQTQQPMVVILLNNDGGGIFNLLPMGKAGDRRSDYFVTPHGLKAEAAAKMFDLGYYAPQTQDSFCSDFVEAMDANTASIIEVSVMPGQGAEHILQTIQQVQAL